MYGRPLKVGVEVGVGIHRRKNDNSSPSTVIPSARVLYISLSLLKYCLWFIKTKENTYSGLDKTGNCSSFTDQPKCFP